MNDSHRYPVPKSKVLHNDCDHMRSQNGLYLIWLQELGDKGSLIKVCRRCYLGALLLHSQLRLVSSAAHALGSLLISLYD